MTASADTIAAIATAPGEAGLAVVRVSGPDALRVADAVFRCGGEPPSRRGKRALVFGCVVAEDGSVIDQSILLIMRAPRSFTGEDVIEIQCHGGRVPASAILRRLLNAGCRVARPGEFTRRAFLSGRIDLVQAEAILHLIRAQTDRAAKMAMSHLEGRLSQHINRIYDRATEAAALLEASLDFPEEDLPDTLPSNAKDIITECIADCVELVEGWSGGRLVRDGVRVVIAGRPNSGKSTLFNALVGKDRAIVTPTPGTTRDSIEEWLSWDGIGICLVDTAGIRESVCPVESEGVRRSIAEAKSADIILYLIDGQYNVDNADERFLEKCPENSTLVILTKSDLWLGPPPTTPVHSLRKIPFSSRSRDSRDSVVSACVEMIRGMVHVEEGHTVLASERHLERVREALSAFRSALENLDGPESDVSVVASSIRNGIEHLGHITGRSFDEDVLDRIFSRFCIGK